MATLEQFLTSQRPTVGGVPLPPAGTQGLGAYLQTVADSVNPNAAPTGYTIGMTPAPVVNGQVPGYNLAIVPSQAPAIPQVEQLAQSVQPTTQVIPAAQVVENTAGISPEMQAMSDYFQSLFPAQPVSTAQTLPTQQATVQQGGSASPYSGSAPVMPVAQRAPLTVAPNGTTNFWQQNENPVRTWNSISNVPEYSLGGQLLLASQLGMTPQQLMGGLDAIQARGITESPYWQDQYNQALEATGDPNAALAHANLAATEAGPNTAGVFARTMAEPTDRASQVAADRAYGRTYLDPNAGSVNQNVLSTVSQPVGATAQGNVLARTPDGSVTTLPVGPYSAANASYTNMGAQAFQNALAREMAATPGVGTGRNAQDPYTQALRRQQLELQVEAARQRLDQAGAKDPRIAQAQTILRALPKDDPRREPYLEFLNTIGTEAGLAAPAANTPVLR